MMGERRQLESIRVLGIGMLVLQIIMNSLLYIIPMVTGRYIDISRVITMKTANTITFMLLIFVSIVSFTSEKKVKSEDIRAEAKERVKFLNLPNIIFIIYIAVALIILRDRSAIMSAFIMEILYVSIIVMTKDIYMFQMQEKRQLDWKKNWEQPNHHDKDSNVFWRLKIWFSPHEYVPFAERWISPFKIFIDFFIIYSFSGVSSKLVSLIAYLFVIPDILSIIEALLGLQTSITGICTGVTQTTQEKSSKICYIVYVTDYENEREIKFTINEPVCCVSELDRVVVIHGVFSKHVMRVQGLKIKTQ